MEQLTILGVTKTHPEMKNVLLSRSFRRPILPPFTFFPEVIVLQTLIASLNQFYKKYIDFLIFLVDFRYYSNKIN